MSSKQRAAQRERDEANYAYFVSLANSRFSLARLPLMAFVTALMLGFDLLPLASLVFFGGQQELSPWFNAHLVMIGASLVVWVLSTFRSWVYRFQVLSTTLMGIFSIVGWVYGTCLLTLSLAAMVDDPSSGGTMVFLPRLLLFGAVGLLYVCGALVAHAWLIGKRLREGHSAERTMGNFGAVSSVYRSKSLWIIFAVAVIGPNVLTGGEHVLMTVCLLGFLFLGAVLTGLPVEFACLTYLKSRDRRYWEKRPPKRVVTRKQASGVLLRVGKWVLIFIAVCVVIGIANGLVANG